MASAEKRLVKRYAAVLRGLDLSASDLGSPHDGDRELTLRRIARDLQSSPVSSVDQLHDCLRDVLAGSDRGIDAPRHYWGHAPAVQLTEVLEPLGYAVRIDRSEGGREFDVVLEGDEERRTTFSYPDDEFGTDNYPALLHAVESRLLPDPNLEFLRLAEGGDDRWRFLLVDRRQVDVLRGQFGDRLDLFGRPLLAARQPDDFTFRQPLDDAADELDLPADEMDDAFRSVERAAAAESAYGRDREDGDDYDLVTRVLQD